MSRRKTFLTALGSTGLALAVASRARAQGAAPAPPAASPMPASAPVPSPAPSAQAAVSAASAALAATMRRFDPHLTDAELATIAAGIDDDNRAGAALNSRKHRLRNSDEPVTAFGVPFE